MLMYSNKMSITHVSTVKPLVATFPNVVSWRPIYRQSSDVILCRFSLHGKHTFRKLAPYSLKQKNNPSLSSDLVISANRDLLPLRFRIRPKMMTCKHQTLMTVQYLHLIKTFPTFLSPGYVWSYVIDLLNRWKFKFTKISIFLYFNDTKSKIT